MGEEENSKSPLGDVLTEKTQHLIRSPRHKSTVLPTQRINVDVNTPGRGGHLHMSDTCVFRCIRRNKRIGRRNKSHYSLWTRSVLNLLPLSGKHPRS